MAGRSKYGVLGQRLTESGLERVQLTFAELDKLCALPPSAYSIGNFWANTLRNNQARSWLGAGYIVESVSLGNSVTFLRDPMRAKDPGAGRKNAAKRKELKKTSEKPPKTSDSERGEKGEETAYAPITAENIERVHRLAVTSAEYGANFALIQDILRRFPQNTDPQLVAMKVALIDVVNSTNLGKHMSKISLAGFVDCIVGISDFDFRVSQGDPELVAQLARSNGKVKLFSLASKYCTYHNADIYGRDDYSIFDSVVEAALPHYIPGLKKGTIDRWRQRFDYVSFLSCIGELLDKNEINIPNRRRKFDHFLWYPNRKKREE